MIGQSKHPLYTVWQGMIRRCSTSSNKYFIHYGGRGISVCERWRVSFENFISDMGPRPPGYTLERIDVNGNYEPKNCKWATWKEQLRNQRVTRRVSIDGKSYVAADLADLSGLKTDTIVERAKQGLKINEILDPAKRVYLDGLRLGGKANGVKRRSMTHCKNGHELTPENVLLTKEGWRACRACHNNRERKRKASRKPTQ